tara:strand:- start:156 stop:452 length:297 start_codon:yes stop_codon:yes gene_type:complete
MLKSEILQEIQKKHNNLSINDIEFILKIFTKKIVSSLNNGNNVEIRGFGTLSKKENKEKLVRNPKTNEKIYKDKTYKLHFKIGKILHNKINPELQSNE